MRDSLRFEVAHVGALLRCAAWGLVLASCSSPSTRIFVLSPVPAAAQSKYEGPPVRVDGVHFPPALDRIEMLERIGPQEYRIDDLSHWGAPLAQSARNVVSADLLERLPAKCVLSPNLPKPSHTLGIVIDVSGFESGSNGASLVASWIINGTAADAAPPRMNGEWRIAAASPGSSGTAQSLSILLGRMADDIALTLLSLPQTTGAERCAS